MRITLFTSNQPRHVALAEALAAIAKRVFVIQECNTIFPGRIADFFRQSPVMQSYFSRVLAAEREVFGPPRFCPSSIRTLALRMGDLRDVELDVLGPALRADVFIVFGASYIRGELCEFLTQQRAVNLHMGVSPLYRGSSCNFWALYDNRPDCVGATIHLLTAGLDSGPILFHALPKAEPLDPFVLGMRAVQAAHHGLVHQIERDRLLDFDPVPQDASFERRYTRNADFTDEVAAEYLARAPQPQAVEHALRSRAIECLVRPYVG